MKKNNDNGDYKLYYSAPEKKYTVVEMGDLKDVILYSSTIFCVRKGGLIYFWRFDYVPDCAMIIYCNISTLAICYQLEIGFTTKYIENVTFLQSRSRKHCKLDSSDMSQLEAMLDYFLEHEVYPDINILFFTNDFITSIDWFRNILINVPLDKINYLSCFKYQVFVANEKDNVIF